jgi:hypothetical protein
MLPFIRRADLSVMASITPGLRRRGSITAITLVEAIEPDYWQALECPLVLPLRDPT